jgi:hypothetical protein
VENCAVTTECGGQIDLILQTSILRSLSGSVYREREVGMQGFGDFGLEDQGDIGVG